MKKTIQINNAWPAMILVAAFLSVPVVTRCQQATGPGNLTLLARTSERRSFSAKDSDRKPSERSAETPPPPASSYNWSGFYIGGHVGYSWGRADTTFDPLPTPAQFVNLAPTTLSPDPKGFRGGVQGGYNWQSGHAVGGFEADLSFSNMNGTARLTPIRQNNGTPFPGAGFLIAGQKTRWTSTYRGRAGVAFSRVLLYGTAGVAIGNARYTADSDFRPVGTEHYPANFNDTRAGFVGGGGAEFGITKHFSVKAEYLYYDLGRAQTTINPALPLPPFQVHYYWETKAHNLNAGFNIRF